MRANIPRILIVNPFGIGDVLFTFPLLEQLKHLYPGAYIGYLGNRRAEPLLQKVPLIQQIFVYEKDEFRSARKISIGQWLRKYAVLLSAIRRQHFDYAFDLSLNREYGFLLLLAGIKRRIGYNYKDRATFLNSRVPLPRGYADKSACEYYLQLLQSLTPRVPAVQTFPDLIVLSDAEKEAVRKKLHFTSGAPWCIGIAPAGGKSWGKESSRKHWPPQKYAQLIDLLSHAYHCKIVVFGSEEETEAARHIAAAVKGSCELYNCAGRLSLQEFMAYLSQCRLLITNDGGPLHLAVFLGLKTVSLFGPTDDRVYGPYRTAQNASRHIVLTTDLACRPCYRNFRMPPCPIQYECLRKIEPETAFQAAQKLLDIPEVRE